MPKGRRRNRDLAANESWGNSVGCSERGHQYKHKNTGSSRKVQRTDREKAHEAASRSSEGASTSSVLEIPGFYYDPEKKRYFKIAPNHATSTCNYTKDALSTKAAEEKRKSDVSDLISSKMSGNTCQTNCNYLHLVFQRSQSGLSRQHVQLEMLRSAVVRLKPVKSEFLFETPGYNENVEHILKMCTSEKHDELLCLWSVRGSWVQRIQSVKIMECSRSQRQESLCVNAKPCLYPVLPQMHKVTDMCWAPLSAESKHVLYTTMCHLGLQESLAIIKTFGSTETTMYQDYSIGRKATWCCCWNPVRSQFSVGTEKSALVLNVERRTMWEYSTNKSDPLSVAFSSQGGNCLHAGTRKGEIHIFDMRSRSTFPVTTLQHKSSVCSINLVNNDTHLIGADFTGKINLWDVRKKAVVMQYEGNVNLYTRLPVHVDETESILHTVGEDGYTRFWSLKEGKQLYTIPPPCPVSRETVPCVQLSTHWGNRNGNLGLIMGLKNKFHYYGTLPLG